MSDYGDFERNMMQRDLEKEEKRWHALNRINRTDRVFFWASWIIGILAGICGVTCVAHEIVLRLR